MRASYGRFNQGVLTGELEPFHPAPTPTTTMAFDPATGGYTASSPIVDPRTNLRLDPETRAPRTDEYSIGVDREFGRRPLAGDRLCPQGGRQLHRLDRCRRPVSRGDAHAAGRPAATGVRDRQRHRRSPLPADQSRRVLADVQRRRHRGSRSAARTAGRRSARTRCRGRRDCKSRAARRPPASQVSTIAGAPYLTFGQDPNSLTNARGRLPNDRPHMLRVMGSVDVPRTGDRGRRNVQHFSGKPWAARAGCAAAGGSARSCSSRAARGGSRRRRSSTCACRDRLRSAARARRAAGRRSQRAQRHRRRGPGDRQLVQRDFRAARFHRSASRDARVRLTLGQ